MRGEVDILHDQYRVKARLALAVVVAFVATPALYGSQASGAPRNLPSPTPSTTTSQVNAPWVSEGAGTVRTATFEEPLEKLRARKKASNDRQRRHAGPPWSEWPYKLPVSERFLSKAVVLHRHHDYPAWDLALPVGTPVFAITAGTVTAATSGGRCGRGVVVAGSDGFTYTYCHGSVLGVRAGSSVLPGQPIMLSGNTGNSTGPHLHLQIANPAGEVVCPQGLLLGWLWHIRVTPEWARSEGCYYATAGSYETDRKPRNHKKSKRAATTDGSGSSSPAPSTERKTRRPSSQPTSSPDPEPTPTNNGGQPSPKPTPQPSSEPSPSGEDEDD